MSVHTKPKHLGMITLSIMAATIMQVLDTTIANVALPYMQGTFGAAPDQILATINRYFFEELSFSGNEQNYYEPDNSYLNRVVDRRLGNPVSLCLIFLFITRRLRLPVTGIGTQGPFICRFQTSKEELYIDVFNKGRLLTKGECLKFLPQASRGFQDGYLTPTTPRRTLLRLCSDLHQIYVHLNDREESERLQRYIIALAK